ncbi:MAG: YncE family protein, partial [Tissierellia bacterium]|nr:YncE family protein [Tissierellia bacterium]
MKKKFKVLVANTGGDSLSYIDLEREKLINTIDLKKETYSNIGPYELVNKGDLVYCTNIYDNSLYKIDIKKGTILDSLYIGCCPSCIKVFKNYFYIVNGDSNSISIVDNESFSLTENIPVGDRPIDMEIDELNRKLYIANSNSRSISRIDLNTKEILNISLENHPLKIILEEGQIYILSIINDSPIPQSSISLIDSGNLKEKKFI